MSGPGFGGVASSSPLAQPVLDTDGGAAVVYSQVGANNVGYGPPR